MKGGGDFVRFHLWWTSVFQYLQIMEDRVNPWKKRNGSRIEEIPKSLPTFANVFLCISSSPVSSNSPFPDFSRHLDLYSVIYPLLRREWERGTQSRWSPLVLTPAVTWSWQEVPDSCLEGSGGSWARSSAPEGVEGLPLQGRAKRRARRTLGWPLATDQPWLEGLNIQNWILSLTWCVSPNCLKAWSSGTKFVVLVKPTLVQ